MADTITHHVHDGQLIDGVATVSIMQEVINERVRQDDKWGQQNHPDGTGEGHGLKTGTGRLDEFTWLADKFRAATDFKASMQEVTWTDILLEEVFEALAESDPAALREELLQVAAVATAWAEAIDRRTK